MRRRRERSLSDEDIALWTLVARTVRPIAGRTLPDMPEPPPSPAAPEPAEAPPKRAAAPKSPKPPAPPPLAPLVPLERKTLTALRRGRQSIEAVIDLHGLRQGEAHDRLRGFLSREQHRGSRLVLVITGKGAAGTALAGDERGVLRRVVPHWLRLPDLRAIVMGFEDAGLNHGGSGALYVRLRRPRDRVGDHAWDDGA